MGSESSKESSHKITKQNSKLKHPILQFAQLIQYNNAGNDNGQNTDEL